MIRVRNFQDFITGRWRIMFYFSLESY